MKLIYNGDKKSLVILFITIDFILSIFLALKIYPLPFTELTGEALEQWEAKKAKAREEILNAEKARKKEKKAAKMTKADYLKQNQDERFVAL